MLPLVGRQADWWNTGTNGGVESFRRKRDIVVRCDFGHVTSTEPVKRFVEEVMAPLRT
jgi:hypothetical protein